ncbi:MAG TPA: hypothetical protein VF471_09825 [Pseudoxanthomonas sp.]
MNRRASFFAAVAAAALAACIAPAVAQTYRVDDSASQILGGTLRLKPQPTAARGRLATNVAGEIAVAVRLDVSPWKGRQARIYLTVPMRPAAAVSTRWTTQGRLLPGELRSGERTLVYAGPIQTDAIEDTLRLEIQADGSKLRRDEQLAFAFEIDLGTP